MTLIIAHLAWSDDSIVLFVSFFFWSAEEHCFEKVKERLVHYSYNIILLERDEYKRYTFTDN